MIVCVLYTTREECEPCHTRRPLEMMSWEGAGVGLEVGEPCMPMSRSGWRGGGYLAWRHVKMELMATGGAIPLLVARYYYCTYYSRITC